MTVRDKLIATFLHRWVLYRKDGNDRHLHFNGPALERIDWQHPLSGLRIARVIRQDGLVEFECVSRLGSTYRITAVHLEKISEDLRKRKQKWTSAELIEIRSTVQQAYIVEGITS